ncbi:MAG: hypothetical protein QN193_09165 [Armatimonadota bacterium]|nr:hypothetical protein [Armatimonadota bacterium]MDR7444406.1 hypothetical protein [Armatimonadota bacterium]MDR7570762.1 hypothetical protein [Armatimonadota bacterium]MDR7614892.1 hypothetical protein [Armatimonadota bacterium]
MSAEAKVLQQIEHSLDDIVRKAESCVTGTRAASLDLEESQLRNLQNLASATDSVLALENFIGYQMGRKKIPAEVGRQILEDMRELSQMAEQIAQKDSALLRRVWMELIRLYLGFLVRKFVAERKG